MCRRMRPGGAGRVERRVPMTRLRARIAERLITAQSTQALLTTFNEVDLLAVQELRARYKDKFEKNHGVKLGFSSFFVKATIEALKRFPVVNAAVDGNDIVYREFYDIGMAVSTDRGLVVPVLRDADLADLRADREGRGRFRHARPQRLADHGRPHRRHLQHHQWRCVRFAAVHADRECAAERHSRHAQDPGAPRGGRTARS